MRRHFDYDDVAISGAAQSASHFWLLRLAAAAALRHLTSIIANAALPQ